jgi:hypothetical protein
MRDTTSASNIFRRKLCPGSAQAEAGIIDDDSGPAADEGTLLHPFACNPKLARDHLEPHQRQLLEKADRGTTELMERAHQTFGRTERDARATWIEEKLTVRGPDGEALFTGRADMALDYPEAKAVVVQDFKMGFLDVTEAPANYQLASYAIAWSDALGAGYALVGINQPRGRGLTTALYDLPGLQAARRELAAIVHASEDRNAPRIPGELQCQWCKAKLFCEEYTRRFRALSPLTEARSIAGVNNDELAQFAIAIKTARRIEHQVMAEVRRRIEAGEMPGWELTENGETREVTDIVGAYSALKDFFSELGGLDPKRFTACTKLSLTALSELVHELTGFPHSRAKKLVSELLNPFITRKPKQPTPTQIL